MSGTVLAFPHTYVFWELIVYQKWIKLASLKETFDYYYHLLRLFWLWEYFGTVYTLLNEDIFLIKVHFGVKKYAFRYLTVWGTNFQYVGSHNVSRVFLLPDLYPWGQSWREQVGTHSLLTVPPPGTAEGRVIGWVLHLRESRKTGL